MQSVASGDFNFTYPTYKLFARDVYSTFVSTWNELNNDDKSLNGWISSIQEYSVLTRRDVINTLLMAAMWTLLRYFATSFIFQPIIGVSGLQPNEANKAPESAWKLLFYSCTWSYSLYLLFFTKHNYFYDPPSSFYNWTAAGPVDTQLYICYMVQLSFYIHSVYGTLFIDVWRKDSVIMLMHHCVTLLLIGFSYTFRYTKVGVLVLFLHDITDILLEGTKLAVYYKTKGGWWFTICDTISTVGFVLFGIAWYTFRLYWFPLKAIYAAGHVSRTVNNHIPFYHFFNTLLFVLLGLNIYWFKFIVVLGWKVVTGQVKEVDDSREYDTTSQIKKQN